MIKTYKSRKKMVRENFVGFDATKMSREDIVNSIKADGYKNFSFNTLAVSHGVYGANGAIVEVKTNADEPETITTFSILSRSTTLLTFL